MSELGVCSRQCTHAHAHLHAQLSSFNLPVVRFVGDSAISV